MLFQKRMSSYAVRAALVGALALTPVLALAPVNVQAASSDEISAELAQVMDELYLLQGEAENCYYELQNTEYNLSVTEEQIVQTSEEIEVTRADLAVAQEQLAEIVADDYKAGSSGLLSVVLGATDFGDFVSRVVYVSKISAYKSDVVSTVKTLQATLDTQMTQLEEQKASQEQLVEEQKERTAAADAAVNAMDAYRSQLSVELQEALAREEEERRAAERAAAEAAARAAEEAAAAEAAARAAEEEQQQQIQESSAQDQQEDTSQNDQSADTSSDNTETPSDTTEQPSDQQSQQNNQSSNQGNQSSSSSSDSSSSSNPSSYTPAPTGSVATMVSRAEMALGSRWVLSGYVWTGDPSTSQFTCSGLVDFALGRSPRSSWPESLYAEVGSRMKYDVSELNYGDLCFYAYAGRYPGHVGIYVGNGMIIDAAGYGVAYRSVTYMTFIGGGPIL